MQYKNVLKPKPMSFKIQNNPNNPNNPNNQNERIIVIKYMNAGLLHRWA